MRKRLLAALVTVALAVTASGCWDRKEIDQVGFIGALAIDLGEDGKVVVSMEVINPRALALGTLGQGAASEIVSVILRDEAASISEAISSAQRRTPRHLTTGQVTAVIFGQSLARKGIDQYVDFLLRDANIRHSVVLATCDTGSGLLQRPLLDPIPSRTLDDLSHVALRSGETVRVTLNEFTVKLYEPGVEPVTMHTTGRETKDIQVKRQGGQVEQKEKAVMLEQPIDSSAKIEGELPDDSPVLDPLREVATGQLIPGMTINIGIAVYKGTKLVGLMDGAEARGYLWLTGELEQTAVEVPDPSGSGKMVGFDVIRANSSIEPDLEGGPDAIKMKAELHVDLEAAQFPAGIDLRQQGVVDALEEALNGLVTREVKATLQRVQTEMKSDIYGFGNEIYKKDPDLWAKLEPAWNDEAFPKIQVELDVQTRVRAPGSIYGLMGSRVK